MLYQSLHVRQGAKPFPRAIVLEPDISRYLRDFGAIEGDDAQVCQLDDGALVGAAWCRRLPADDGGYGYVSADVPELGMAVDEPWRAQGIGRRLLADLLDRNPAMSLSVDDENQQAVGLYRSLGFAVQSSADGTTIMYRAKP